MHTDAVAGRHDPYFSLRNRDYRYFLSGTLVANLGMRMQAAAVLWEVYERTQSAMALAWVGLVQVLPVLALALLAGQIADRSHPLDGRTGNLTPPNCGRSVSLRFSRPVRTMR